MMLKIMLEIYRDAIVNNFFKKFLSHKGINFVRLEQWSKHDICRIYRRSEMR